MNRDRFETLAETYGGDIARWPAEARDAATELLVREPEFARTVLARAAELDEALAAYAVEAPSAALTGRILAAAPRPARARWRAWLTPAGLGAALAAAGVAGVLVGAEVAQRAPQSGSIATADGGEDFNLYLEEDA